MWPAPIYSRSCNCKLECIVQYQIPELATNHELTFTTVVYAQSWCWLVQLYLYVYGASCSWASQPVFEIATNECARDHSFCAEAISLFSPHFLLFHHTNLSFCLLLPPALICRVHGDPNVFFLSIPLQKICVYMALSKSNDSSHSNLSLMCLFAFSQTKRSRRISSKLLPHSPRSANLCEAAT